MAIAAMGMGIVSALAGLALAFRLDTPVGPTIVCVAVAAFALTRTGAALARR